MRLGVRRIIILLATVAILLGSLGRASALNLSNFKLTNVNLSNFKLTDPDTWPFIPIPEVATDPNGGTTYGLLPVFLYHDKKSQRIRAIFAPDITNNTTLGVGGTFRYLAYPSEDTQWSVVGAIQQTKTRRVDLQYETGRTRSKWWSLETRFFFEHDPSMRFYGIGNESSSTHQTNYMIEQLYFQVLFGINLSKTWQIALVERPRYVRIKGGAFNSLPFIGDLFPNVTGLGGGTEFLSEVVGSYDTRNSVDIPTSGTLARVWAGVADRSLGSSYSYSRFGLEVRHYFPFGERFNLATRGYVNVTPSGNEAPFWSISSLGGDHDAFFTMQETFRGYGTDRFVDNNLMVFNAELRTNIFTVDLFKTRATFQPAPFLAAGRVWHSLSDNPFCRFHLVGGMAFRAVIKPFVVGYVDVGSGGHGIAVFSGINYPF